MRSFTDSDLVDTEIPLRLIKIKKDKINERRTDWAD